MHVGSIEKKQGGGRIETWWALWTQFIMVDILNMTLNKATAWGEVTSKHSGVVVCYGVCLPYNFDYIIKVCSFDIIDAKVIDDDGEGDVSWCIFEEPVCVVYMCLAVGCEVNY